MEPTLTRGRDPAAAQPYIHNTAINIAGESLWGLQAALVAPATVLTVLLASLQASEMTIGSIAAIEGGLIVAPQILGNYLFHSRRHRKRDLMLWHFVVILPLLFVMAALACPAFPTAAAARRLGLLAAFALFISGIGVATPAWADWLAFLFPQQRRGMVMGVTWFSASVAAAGGALLSGWAINNWPGMSTYAWLYAGAGLLAYASLAVFCFMNDAEAAAAPPTLPPRTADLLRRFRDSLGDRNFRAFLVGRVLATAGFCMVPFIAVYYISAQGGGMARGTVVSSGAAQAVGMALSGLLLGRLGDERGHRLGMLIGVATQVGALALILLSSGLWSCLVAYFGVGVCISVGMVSHFNMLFETCPHDARMAHITVGNTVISVAAIGAPLLAGLVAGTWGLKPLFAICLALSVLALLWFVMLVKEPRDENLLAACRT